MPCCVITCVYVCEAKYKVARCYYRFVQYLYSICTVFVQYSYSICTAFVQYNSDLEL